MRTLLVAVSMCAVCACGVTPGPNDGCFAVPDSSSEEIGVPTRPVIATVFSGVLCPNAGGVAVDDIQLVDPDNVPWPFTSRFRDDEVSSVLVEFIPDRPGSWHLTARFAGGGVVQRNLVVVQPVETPATPLAQPEVCRSWDPVDARTALCLSYGELRLYIGGVLRSAVAASTFARDGETVWAVSSSSVALYRLTGGGLLVLARVNLPVELGDAALHADSERAWLVTDHRGYDIQRTGDTLSAPVETYWPEELQRPLVAWRGASGARVGAGAGQWCEVSSAVPVRCLGDRGTPAGHEARGVWMRTDTGVHFYQPGDLTASAKLTALSVSLPFDIRTTMAIQYPVLMNGLPLLTFLSVPDWFVPRAQPDQVVLERYENGRSLVEASTTWVRSYTASRYGLISRVP